MRQSLQVTKETLSPKDGNRIEDVSNSDKNNSMEHKYKKKIMNSVDPDCHFADRLCGPLENSDSKFLAMRERSQLADLFMFIYDRATAEKHAEKLLSKFSSAADVIAADGVDLRSAGATDGIVAILGKIHEAAKSFTRVRIRNKIILGSDEELRAYLSTLLGRQKVENFHVVYLDSRRYLLEDFTLYKGCENHVGVYVSEILRLAVQIRSSSFIIAHNHPSGDLRPSQSDLELTKRLIIASRILDKELEDHYIVSASGILSLRSLDPFGDLWPLRDNSSAARSRSISDSGQICYVDRE